MLGSSIGSLLGGHLGKRFGGEGGRRIGEAVGHVGGSLLPFKTGGRVPGKKGRARKAMVHGGEYILPVGVKPTKAQKAKVAKAKARK